MSGDPGSYVREWGDDLQMSDIAVGMAVGFARRAWYEYPVNRSGKAVAAGSLYLGGLYANEKRTQDVIAEVSGVSTVTIRYAYRDIMAYEDPDAAEQLSWDSDTGDAPGSGPRVPMVFGELRQLTGMGTVLTLAFVLAIGAAAFVVSFNGVAEAIDPAAFEQVGVTVIHLAPAVVLVGIVVAFLIVPIEAHRGGRS